MGARGHQIDADQCGHLRSLPCCTAFLGSGWADLGGSQPIGVSFLGLAPPWAASGPSWPGQRVQGRPRPGQGTSGHAEDAEPWPARDSLLPRQWPHLASVTGRLASNHCLQTLLRPQQPQVCEQRFQTSERLHTAVRDCQYWNILSTTDY